ncbi:MAG TPA: hypothetical protein VFC71_00645 [Candidatus Polarisedimenticolia bacterium]|nr:hypothetical protein [Candidatus Polarisedimenticolia bacterium]
MSDRGTRVAALLFGLAGAVTLALLFGQARLPANPDVSLPTETSGALALEPDARTTGSAAPGQTSTAGPNAPSSAAASPSIAALATTHPAASQAPAPTKKPNPTAPPTPAPTPAPTPGPTLAPTPPPAPPPSLASCDIFPASNVWNRPVNGLPVASNSDAMVAAIGLGAGLHPDFSDGGWYGIPFNVVGTATPRSTVSFQYDDESDHVGYPIPASPAIEGGSDRHILMVETNECRLYELFAAQKSGSSWSAGSGATWDLGSNALRTAGWTSADAAGLPIFPGLVRYEEVAAGAIHHAIRFTAPSTCNGYIYPARHQAGSGSCAVNPPMGLRVRLKASVDISGFGPQARIVLQALKTYGMLLADNGSPWYITGAPSHGWDDDDLHDLGQVHGDAFEVVDTAGFVNG